MASSGTIEHLGTVSDVSGKMIRVSIMPRSACGNCMAKGSCSINDTGERTVEVVNRDDHSYSPGEDIKVILEQSLGLKALAIGYFLPFLVLLIVLVVSLSLGASEGVAGLTALFSLVPYYAGLSLFRDRLKKEFSFRLEKLQ